MSGQGYHLDSLENNEVYFSNFEELNDPYEGLLKFNWDEENITDATLVAAVTQKLYRENHHDINTVKDARQVVLKTQKQKGKEAFKRDIEIKSEEYFHGFLNVHKNERFVLSLAAPYEEEKHEPFPAPLNNMMMWAHYANGLRGLCVEYDFEVLRESINDASRIGLKTKPITYADKNLPTVEGSTMLDDMIHNNGNTSHAILDAFCTKQNSWGYENEIRMISPTHKTHRFREDAITRVFVSETNRDIARLKGILGKKAHNPELFIVSVNDQQYGFVFKKEEY